MNEKDQNLNEEVVSVEPGSEGLTVEQEIEAETPKEEVIEENKETSTEEKAVEADDEKEEAPSTEKQKEEEVVEDSTDTPQEKVEETDEKKETEEEKKEEEKEEGNKEDNDQENNEADEGKTEEQEPEQTAEEKMAELEAQIASMKEEEETRAMIDDRQSALVVAERTYNDFNEKLSGAILDTLKQYGIDPDVQVEELKKDPAKFQIAQDILNQARILQVQKQQELMNPITDLSNQIVFRKAGNLMSKFDMTDEQSNIAVETLINIFNQTGLADLDADLKAKVELAVARAKMIAPKVEKVIEETKEIVQDVKDTVEDVLEEKVVEKVEEEIEKEEVTEEENKPKEELKSDLSAFKEGASIGEVDASAAVSPITVDNVLTEMAKLNFKDRTAFYAEHRDLINEAMSKKRK